MLLCWCIERAVSQTEAFYPLPVDGKLMAYDQLAINTAVSTRDGGPAAAFWVRVPQEIWKMGGRRPVEGR